MPVARWVEYQTGVPYIEEILEQPFAIGADGMLEIPTGPGLGIALNREAIERFAAGK
jgi:L-alanine-DL-glutamate epimerase-like enolase superfamily enzyme